MNKMRGEKIQSTPHISKRKKGRNKKRKKKRVIIISPGSLVA
jgi:hypothetical protein